MKIFSLKLIINNNKSKIVSDEFLDSHDELQDFKNLDC